MTNSSMQQKPFAARQGCMWQLAKRLTTACLCAGMPLEQLIPPAKVLFPPSSPQHCLHRQASWLLQLVVVAFVLCCPCCVARCCFCWSVRYLFLTDLKMQKKKMQSGPTWQGISKKQMQPPAALVRMLYRPLLYLSSVIILGSWPGPGSCRGNPIGRCCS